MTADDRLRSLFADDAPLVDAGFILGVQQALARRRLLNGLLALFVWAAAATALMWALARWAEPVIFSAAPTLYAAAPTIVLGLTATIWTRDRLRLA
jgi:hypothetical protein